MNEETNQRAFVHVPWDGENVEIRMLNAIEDLCRKGRREAAAELKRMCDAGMEGDGIGSMYRAMIAGSLKGEG